MTKAALAQLKRPDPHAIAPAIRDRWRSSTRPIRGTRPTWSSACLAEAQAAGASDIHFQPGGDGLELRWRIDGVLQPVALLPAKVAPNIVARLKVLSELLTYRTDVPQEGRIQGVPGEVEMRVSTFPTLFGEKAVVRMFAGPGRFLRLVDLGLPESVRDELDHLLGETSGAIVLSGPAGSGKTTTIYACLRELAARSRGERSLATLEDPDRGRRAGRCAGPGQPGGRSDARVGLEIAAAPGPRGDRHRRDPRQDHRRDRLAGRPHRPFDPHDLSRRQRLRGDRPVPRHGNRALRGAQRAARRRRPAPGAPALRLRGRIAAGPKISSACPCATPGCRAAVTLAAGPATRGEPYWPSCSCPKPTSWPGPCWPSSDVRRLERSGRRRRHDRSLGARLRAVEEGLTSPAEVRRILGVATFPSGDNAPTFVRRSSLTSSDNCGEILVIQVS